MDEANKYALAALKRKRAEISGFIISLQKQIEDRRLELSALDSSIRLFLPDYKPGDVKPIRPKTKPQHFEPGELIRLILNTLREADGKPLSTAEVTSGVIAQKGHPESMRPLLNHRVLCGLNYLSRHGARVVKIGYGKSNQWALP